MGSLTEAVLYLTHLNQNRFSLDDQVSSHENTSKNTSLVMTTTWPLTIGPLK